jgi:hypothetical protein
MTDCLWFVNDHRLCGCAQIWDARDIQAASRKHSTPIDLNEFGAVTLEPLGSAYNAPAYYIGGHAGSWTVVDLHSDWSRCTYGWGTNIAEAMSNCH